MNRFVSNPLADELLAKDIEVGKELTKRAETIADYVRRIGPVDQADPGHHYVEQITVDSGLDGLSQVGRVNANKFTAWWIEAGTSQTPAFAPLRHAVEMSGLRMTE